MTGFNFAKRRRTVAEMANLSVLVEKWKESLLSVLPITALMLLLCFFLVPLPSSALSGFVFGSCLLVIGMGLFNLGAEMAMTPIGEGVGASLTASRRLWVVLLAGFLAGVLVTVAEPDLTVLATQVPSVSNFTIIISVALGVGIFLMLALWRILFRVKMWILLLASYALVFLLAQFVPTGFMAVAFDSGGVTTGPMTVPFILSLGAGVAGIRSDKGAESDSFGLVALASVGPILSVMILAIIFNPRGGESAVVSLNAAENSMALFQSFSSQFPHYMKEMLLSLLPVVGFFLVFQFISLRLVSSRLRRIVIGLVFTYTGLVLFMTGVNVGFMPVGWFIGKSLGAAVYRWALVPVGALTGWFVVSAEPAVAVLSRQVYDMTAGAVSQKALKQCLSAGVAISVGLAMTRVILRIPVMYFLAPGYALAMLLMIFSPPVFTSIAFDSGGVASGPMTAAFLLPMAMGACESAGGDVVADAFGVVALVAMTPLIAIQLLGIVYGTRTRRVRGGAGGEREEIIVLMEDEE